MILLWESKTKHLISLYYVWKYLKNTTFEPFLTKGIYLPGIFLKNNKCKKVVNTYTCPLRHFVSKYCDSF